MKAARFKVSGMSCGRCLGKIANALFTVPGIARDAVDLSLSSGNATVRYDENLASQDQLWSAVRSTGYGVEVSEVPEASHLLRQERTQLGDISAVPHGLNHSLNLP